MDIYRSRYILICDINDRKAKYIMYIEISMKIDGLIYNNIYRYTWRQQYRYKSMVYRHMDLHVNLLYIDIHYMYMHIKLTQCMQWRNASYSLKKIGAGRKGYQVCL